MVKKKTTRHSRAASQAPVAHITRKKLKVPGEGKSKFNPTITEQQIFEVIGPPKSLIKRMLRKPRKGAAWLKIVRKAEKDSEEGCLVDYESFRRAYKRLMAGEKPPPLPGKRTGATPLASASGLPTAAGRAILRLISTIPDLREITLISRRKSLVVRWADETRELYKLSRSKDGVKQRLLNDTYDPRCLDLLDQIWSAEKNNRPCIRKLSIR
jgi:hypothetical protein